MHQRLALASGQVLLTLPEVGPLALDALQAQHRTAENAGRATPGIAPQNAQ
jgi:hypothetical protein